MCGRINLFVSERVTCFFPYCQQAFCPEGIRLLYFISGNQSSSIFASSIFSEHVNVCFYPAGILYTASCFTKGNCGVSIPDFIHTNS